MIFHLQILQVLSHNIKPLNTNKLVQSKYFL